MGRDTFGRDIFARVLYAGRVSLLVGVGVGGARWRARHALGLVAGYGGRWIENVVMRGVDVLMAFPELAARTDGAGRARRRAREDDPGDRPRAGAAVRAGGARRDAVAQGRASSSRRRAASAPAAARIVGRHILPNLLGETVVLASLLTASAIRIEASLSFIGLGVSPPTPTWGNMIRDGVPLLLNAPWLSIFPGLAILLSVLAFNLLGDGLRDVLDPRITRRRRKRAPERTAPVATSRRHTAAPSPGLRTSA